MLQVIVELLPSAFGAAISPLPLLVILYTRGAKSVAFLLGIVIGMLLLGGATFLLSAAVPATSSQDSNAVVKLAVGVLFCVLAWRQWQGRPRPGHPATPPKWVSGIDAASTGRVFSIGVGMGIVNPKNTALTISAVLQIAGAHLTTAGGWVAYLVFTFLSCLPLIVIAAAPALFGSRSAAGLDGARRWLDYNSNVVMAVLFGYLALTNLLGGLVPFLGGAG